MSADGPGLTGQAVLARTDGRRWSVVLQPRLVDTRYDWPDFDLSGERLELLDALLAWLLDALDEHPLPRSFLGRFRTTSRAAPKISAAFLSSELVAFRAERLLQSSELVACALAALENDSIQIACLSARAMLEIGAASSSSHSKFLASWNGLLSRDGVKDSSFGTRAVDEVRQISTELFGARYGSRVDKDLPKATNAMTLLGKLGKDDSGESSGFGDRLTDLYSALSEAAHPNNEASAQFWRAASTSIDGYPLMPFSPGRTESPTKLYCVDALILGLRLNLALARDLWWIASVVTMRTLAASHPMAKELGLPARRGPYEQCCCGAGLKSRFCGHPDRDVAEIETGWLETLRSSAS